MQMSYSVDTTDLVNDWISVELEKTLGREPTPEEHQRVVDELPERVSRSDVNRIVAQLFGNGR